MKLSIFCDGGARGNPGPAAIGVVIFADGEKFAEIGQRIGFATNNVAEYQALKRGLEEAVKICHQVKLGRKEKIDFIEVFADSQLVIGQVTGQFKIKNQTLAKILGEILMLEKLLPKIKYSFIERKINWEADRLVNLALNQRPKNE